MEVQERALQERVDKCTNGIRADWHLTVVLVTVAAAGIVMIPKWHYPGDNCAVRMETAHLIMTGELGVDYSRRSGLAELLQNRGQYLYENDIHQRLYSRYGIGFTILYIPPLFAARLIKGELDLLDNSATVIACVSVWQIILSMLAAFYLYSISGLYTKRRSVAVVFVLSSIYATMLWNYLRSPTLEIFQIVPFIGLFHHFIKFLRSANPSEGRGHEWKEILYSSLYAGLLLTQKLHFAYLVPVFSIFALISGDQKIPKIRRAATNIRNNYGKYALYAFVPLSIFISLIMLVNYIKYGSPFDTGYFQWRDGDGLVHDRFSLSFVSSAIAGFILKNGNANIFFNYPVLVFAAFGFFRHFTARRTETSLIIATATVHFLIISAFSGWHGEMCYGPRHLLVALMILGIPFVTFMEILTQAKTAVRIVTAAVVALVLAWSLAMQLYVNSLHYFAFQQVEYALKMQKVHGVDEYIQEKTALHRGFMCRDMLLFHLGKKPFKPFQIMENADISQAQRRDIPRLVRFVGDYCEPNYMFLMK